MDRERLKPIDLENVALPRAFRGYEAKSVNTLLAKAADEIAALLNELKAAREECEALRTELDGYRSQEGTLKEALVLAQKAADETRALAHRQADQIVEDARRQANELQRDLQTRINDLRFELERLGLEKHRFLNQLRSQLEEQLSSVVSELSTASAKSPKPRRTETNGAGKAQSAAGSEPGSSDSDVLGGEPVESSPDE
jgi:cell division initiation protein